MNKQNCKKAVDSLEATAAAAATVASGNGSKGGKTRTKLKVHLEHLYVLHVLGGWLRRQAADPPACVH